MKERVSPWWWQTEPLSNSDPTKTFLCLIFSVQIMTLGQSILWKIGFPFSTLEPLASEPALQLSPIKCFLQHLESLWWFSNPIRSSNSFSLFFLTVTVTDGVLTKYLDPLDWRFTFLDPWKVVTWWLSTVIPLQELSQVKVTFHFQGQPISNYWSMRGITAKIWLLNLGSI